MGPSEVSFFFKKNISAILTSSGNISNRFVPDQIKYFGSLTKIKHFIKFWSPRNVLHVSAKHVLHK